MAICGVSLILRRCGVPSSTPHSSGFQGSCIWPFLSNFEKMICSAACYAVQLDFLNHKGSFPNIELEIRKKIRIKYCGGCNPTYERVEMVERVQSRLEDRFLFLRHDQQDLDGLILINGCPRSCASENLNRIEAPHFSIAGERDFKSLIDWLMALEKKTKTVMNSVIHQTK